MGVLDWIFPKQCLGCKEPGSYVCSRCAVGVWEEEQICPSCGRKSKYGVRHSWCEDCGLDGVVSVYAYDGIAKKAVETMKYKYRFDVVSALIPSEIQFADREDLGKFVFFANTEKPSLVPVPLWVGREKDRGFNQAKVLAIGIGRSLRLDVASLLVRTRDTGKQVGRSRKERLAAMGEAFAIDNKQMKFVVSKNGAIVVDDVWTTGSTMRACGTELKRNGFNQVWGVVLAR